MNRHTLEYLVKKPRVDSESPAPVLILLHGQRSNEQDLMGLAHSLDERFLVISVRAPIHMGPSSFAWYHVQFTPDGFLINEAEATQSRDLLLQFLNEISNTYSLHPGRLFLMGFSQGAIMSLAAALTQPRRLAGVVAMSGRLLSSLLRDSTSSEQLRGLPVMVVHGTQDEVIPVAHGREIRDTLSKLPVDLTWREYPMAHQVTPNVLKDVSQWLSSRLDAPSDWRDLRA